MNNGSILSFVTDVCNFYRNASEVSWLRLYVQQWRLFCVKINFRSFNFVTYVILIEMINPLGAKVRHVRPIYRKFGTLRVDEKIHKEANGSILSIVSDVCNFYVNN